MRYVGIPVEGHFLDLYCDGFGMKAKHGVAVSLSLRRFATGNQVNIYVIVDFNNITRLPRFLQIQAVECNFVRVFARGSKLNTGYFATVCVEVRRQSCQITKHL